MTEQLWKMPWIMSKACNFEWTHEMSFNINWIIIPHKLHAKYEISFCSQFPVPPPPTLVENIDALWLCKMYGDITSRIYTVTHYSRLNGSQNKTLDASELSFDHDFLSTHGKIALLTLSSWSWKHMPTLVAILHSSTHVNSEFLQMQRNG